MLLNSALQLAVLVSPRGEIILFGTDTAARGLIGVTRLAFSPRSAPSATGVQKAGTAISQLVAWWGGYATVEIVRFAFAFFRSQFVACNTLFLSRAPTTPK